MPNWRKNQEKMKIWEILEENKYIEGEFARKELSRMEAI